MGSLYDPSVLCAQTRVGQHPLPLRRPNGAGSDATHEREPRTLRVDHGDELGLLRVDLAEEVLLLLLELGLLEGELGREL